MKIFITLISQAPCSRDCPVRGGCKLPPARAGGCSQQGQAGEVMEVACWRVRMSGIICCVSTECAQLERGCSGVGIL